MNLEQPRRTFLKYGLVLGELKGQLALMPEEGRGGYRGGKGGWGLGLGRFTYAPLAVGFFRRGGGTIRECRDKARVNRLVLCGGERGGRERVIVEYLSAAVPLKGGSIGSERGARITLARPTINGQGAQRHCQGLLARLRPQEHGEAGKGTAGRQGALRRGLGVFIPRGRTHHELEAGASRHRVAVLRGGRGCGGKCFAWPGPLSPAKTKCAASFSLLSFLSFLLLGPSHRVFSFHPHTLGSLNLPHARSPAPRECGAPPQSCRAALPAFGRGSSGFLTWVLSWTGPVPWSG